MLTTGSGAAWGTLDKRRLLSRVDRLHVSEISGSGQPNDN